MSFLKVLNSLLQLLVCSNPLGIMHIVNQPDLCICAETIPDHAAQ